jgi:sarcosine oxidase
VSNSFDVAVIGLGATGSAALYHLALRGLRVVGLERATPGHEGGSSHGESRIVRMAYFEHPSYVPLVRAAYRNWRALEAASGQPVITTTGILETGYPGSNLVRATLASAVEHGLPHEVLGGRAASARFPAFDLPADWEAVFQPDAGALSADKAIRLHVEGARAAGAEVRNAVAVAGIEPGDASVRLVLQDGSALEVGAVVVSAGGWIGELVPDLAPHLTLTRQVVGWFSPSAPAMTGPDRLPVFLLETDAHAYAPADVIYGFPDFAGTGVKAASHNHGRVLASADAARQDANEAEVDPVLATLRRLIPAAAGPVRQVKTCIYTSTLDEHFIVDRHPSDPRIVLASACSGHGFKFASVLGEILADLATGRDVQHDISRFGLERLQGF